MEVRQQLRDAFQELQFDGAIIVEQPPSATPRFLRQRRPPPPAPLRSPPFPLSLSPAFPPPLLQRKGPLPDKCATFHCCKCWTVLGDSLELCTQKQRLGILVCLKVTDDVVWKKTPMVGLEGTLLGCTYFALSCRSCGTVVGFVLYSATRNLAHLRGFFCFFMDRILCYLLENKKIMKASAVNFPDTNLNERLQKLKEKLVKAHIRIELLMNQLEELARKNNVPGRQSPALELASLPPGYAIVRVNQY